MTWRSAGDLLEALDEHREGAFEDDRSRRLRVLGSGPQPPEDGVGWAKLEDPRTGIGFNHVEVKLVRRMTVGQVRYQTRCACGWMSVAQRTQSWARRAFNRHTAMS